MEIAEKYMEAVKAFIRSYDVFYNYICCSSILTKDEKDRIMEQYINNFADIMGIEYKENEN